MTRDPDDDLARRAAAAVAMVEAALVDDGRRQPSAPPATQGTVGVDEQRALAEAASVAVAARFLAVGTPRTLGLLDQRGDGGLADARAALAALRTVFPRLAEPRCAAATPDAGEVLAAALGGRVTTAAAACACDVVLAWGGAPLPRSWLRRGTFLALLAGATVEPTALAGDTKLVADAAPPTARPAWWGTLGQVAAGIVDGRELDELTVYEADGGLAVAALAAAGPR